MTVLRLFRRPEIEQHRTPLCEWLAANGIDPATVYDQWLSIEQEGNRPFIRYCSYKTTTDGRRLVDPDNCNQPWTEQLTAPMVVGLRLTPTAPAEQAST